MLHFNKEGICRYGIMDRHSPDVETIKWFDLPPHYVSHIANSWNETNYKGEEIVKMFGIAYSDVNMDMQSQEKLFSPENKSDLYKFEFNMATGEA